MSRLILHGPDGIRIPYDPKPGDIVFFGGNSTPHEIESLRDPVKYRISVQFSFYPQGQESDVDTAQEAQIGLGEDSK